MRIGGWESEENRNAMKRGKRAPFVFSLPIYARIVHPNRAHTRHSHSNPRLQLAQAGST